MRKTTGRAARNGSRCSRLTRLREGQSGVCLRSSSTCSEGLIKAERNALFRRALRRPRTPFCLLHLAVCRVQCNR